MANIILTLVSVTVLDDGNYSVQARTSSGDTYTVKLTPTQCVDLPTIQTTINNIAQPFKYIGQQITVTL